MSSQGTERAMPAPRAWAGALLCALALTSLAGCDTRARNDENVRDAAELATKGDYRAAMTLLKTVLVKDPGHTRARAELARVDLAVGDAEGAQKELDHALAGGADAKALEPLRLDILIARDKYEEVVTLLQKESSLPPARRLTYIARAQSGLRNYAEADRTAAEALKLAPADAHALLESARARLGLGQNAEAMQFASQALAKDERLPAAWVMRGQLFINQRQIEQARDAFRAGIEKTATQVPTPDEFSLRVGLTETSMLLGDSKGAADSLRTLDKRFPELAVVAYLRARFALMHKDYDSAVAELRRSLQLAPEVVPARLLLGATLLQQGYLEQADAELSRILSADKDNLTARKLAAQVNLSRKRPDEARRLLNQTTGGAADAQLDWLMGAALMQSGSQDEGIARLEKSVAATPDSLDKRIALAKAYVTAGKTGKAAEALQALPSSNPEAAALLVLVNVVGKEPAEARRALDRFLESHPSDSSLWSTAGAWSLSRGDLDGARLYLNRSIAIDPKNAAAHMRLAELAMRQSDMGNAQRELEAAHALDPTLQEAAVALAGLSWMRGDKPAARKRLEQVIVADPAAVAPRLYLAQLAFAEGDAQRARSLLEQAVSVSSSRGEALNAVGEALARSGNLEDALLRFREAAAAGFPGATVNIARAQLALGQEEEGIRTLERAFAASPRSIHAGVLLAERDAHQGRFEDAERRIAQMREAGLPPFAIDELRGDMAVARQKYDDAYAAYSRAANTRPSSELVLKVLHSGLAAGRPDAAAAVEQWLKRTPDDSRARFAFAEALRRNGKVADAIGHYEVLANAAKPDPVTLNNLAWLYEQRKDGRTLATARRAYELAPKVPQIADTYGWFLVENGKVKEGLPLLEEAAAALPADPDVQYHLSAAAARAGDKARATMLLTNLLKKNDRFDSRARAEQLRAQLAN